MKFIEGKWYRFKIEKVISLPEKGDFFVLCHDSGRKMLLNSAHYHNYQYQIGQEISCRIDKVNCTGQIFLEPEHPLYKEQESYEFEVTSTKQCYENIYVLEVYDIFRNILQIIYACKTDFKIENSVRLKVDRIKKGIPLLDFEHMKVNENDFKDVFNINQKYIFNVLKNIQLGKENYWLLESDANKSILKEKHYKHYNIIMGEQIYCNVIGYQSNGLLKVEPINPWYQVGESYTFIISGLEEIQDIDGNIISNLIVYDNQGNKCSVEIPNLIFSEIRNAKSLLCKVIGFKKGRPQLEIDH